jgi:hypothetical protein
VAQVFKVEDYQRRKDFAALVRPAGDKNPGPELVSKPDSKPDSKDPKKDDKKPKKSVTDMGKQMFPTVKKCGMQIWDAYWAYENNPIIKGNANGKKREEITETMEDAAAKGES